MPLAWLLFPELLGFLSSGQVQADPALLCCAGAAQRGWGSPRTGCGREKLMPNSPLSQGQVPEPAAPAALGDAAQLTRVGSEC